MYNAPVRAFTPPVAGGQGASTKDTHMLLLIDNYDSFTWNLVHALAEQGAETRVIRNDDMTAREAMALRPAGVLLSPGPCDPSRAGICLDMVAACAEAGTPLLGVCLGHQALGQAFGGRVVRAGEIVHGKTGRMLNDGTGVFAELAGGVRRHPLPFAHRGTGDAAGGIGGERGAGGRDDHGAAAPRLLPIHGVQFHPESIASEHGHALLAQFPRDAPGRGARTGVAA